MGIGWQLQLQLISEKSGYVLSTQIAITVIYTCNMFVLFCACDVMNVLSVKKNMKIFKKNNKKKKLKITSKSFALKFELK